MIWRRRCEREGRGGGAGGGVVREWDVMFLVL